MSWATEFPEELLRKPTGLVVFTGLKIAINPTHKAIWEGFTVDRNSNRMPLHFKLEDIEFEYSKSKPKRPSYDWYIPKGLLKTGWMKKHLDLVPSLVVLFIDCDWEDSLWKTKLLECVNGVKFIRSQLNGRSTKVGLVLIQKSVPLPPGEDIIGNERATTVCSLCDLPNKLLFVLPITESLIGYTVRLEQAFMDLSRTYYHNEARWVKTHKDFLNKTTHALLFVRHQTKIAFFNELKQDSHTALKHYKQAYTYVQELRVLDFNILEIKTIAGFLNYKICNLAFSHSMPLDAISQFRRHVDFFKLKLVLPELNFEHTAWMAKQFQIFGDLFDEAIKQGLSAILTQHPGIYYQQAAHHAANRRTLSQTTCQSVEGVVSADFVATLHTLDYYGQRPWRQGQQSIEPPDVLKEREGIRMLRLLENQVNHSKTIIPLLGSAVTHAKRYKSPRMKRHLLAQLMNEYYFSKEYSKALSLVSRATHEYRKERWWMVLTSILGLALKCAYLSADVQEYVTLCVQLVGVYSLLKKKDKLRLLNNLQLILEGETPEAEADVETCHDVSEAGKLWRQSSGTHKQRLFRVNMAHIIPFVDCKVQFSREVFQSDSKIVINVFIRSQTVRKMVFEKLFLTLNNETYNKFCVYENVLTTGEANNEKEGLLSLAPGKGRQVSFSFVPLPSDVGSQLEVTSIVLEMGSPNHVTHFQLVWTESSLDTTTPSICCQRNLIAITSTAKKLDEEWQAIKLEPYAKISSRKPQIRMDIKLHNPVFVGELACYEVDIINKEKYFISNVRCNVILDPNVLPAIKNSTTMYISSTGSNNQLKEFRRKKSKVVVADAQDHSEDKEEEEKKGEKIVSNLFKNTTTINTDSLLHEVRDNSDGSFNNSEQMDAYFSPSINNKNNNKLHDDSDSVKCEEEEGKRDGQMKLEGVTMVDDAKYNTENIPNNINMSTNSSFISLNNNTTTNNISNNPITSNNNHSTFHSNHVTTQNDDTDTACADDDEGDDLYVGGQDNYMEGCKNSLKAMHPIMMELQKGLLVSDEASCVFYSVTQQPGSLYMLVSVTYDIVTGEGEEQTVSRCVDSRTLSIVVMEALEVQVDLLNLKLERLLLQKDAPTQVDHSFLLTLSLLNPSQSPLQITHTKLHKNVGVGVDDDEIEESHLKGEVLQQNEVATESFCMCSNVFQDQTLSLGKYSVHMMRKFSSKEKQNQRNETFCKNIELPRVCISSSPLYVDLILPSFGVVHENLFIFYTIRNMSSVVQELTISMETCEGFMFSGHKQVTVRVLPLSNIQLKYNLVPLIPGNLALPKLKIINQQFPDFQLENHRQTPLPTSVFVKPQPKFPR